MWRDRKRKKCPDSHHLQGRGGMGRGGQRGGSSSQRGGGRHGGPQGPQPTLDKPKREAILDLAKYANARIRVKFTGGREGMCLFIQPHPADDDHTLNLIRESVTGVLKGYDQLFNLVLDEVEEQIQSTCSISSSALTFFFF